MTSGRPTGARVFLLTLARVQPVPDTVTTLVRDRNTRRTRVPTSPLDRSYPYLGSTKSLVWRKLTGAKLWGAAKTRYVI